MNIKWKDSFYIALLKSSHSLGKHINIWLESYQWNLRDRWKIVNECRTKRQVKTSLKTESQTIMACIFQRIHILPLLQKKKKKQTNKSGPKELAFQTKEISHLPLSSWYWIFAVVMHGFKIYQIVMEILCFSPLSYWLISLISQCLLFPVV